jgi:hypothetical protein
VSGRSSRVSVPRGPASRRLPPRQLPPRPRPTVRLSTCALSCPGRYINLHAVATTVMTSTVVSIGRLHILIITETTERSCAMKSHHHQVNEQPAHKTHSPAEALRPPRRSGRHATSLTDVHDSLTATFTEHVQERFRHHNTISTRPASTDGPTWCWSAPHDKSLFLYTPYRCAHVVVHAIHRRKGPIKDHRGARLTREAATRCRSTMKLERPARPPPRHARCCHGAATCSCTIGLSLRRTDDTLLCEPTLTTIVRLLEVSAPSGRLQDPRVPHREARMSSSVEMRVCCRVTRRR